MEIAREFYGSQDSVLSLSIEALDIIILQTVVAQEMR